MRKTRSLPITAALGLTILAGPPEAVSQVSSFALAAKRGINLQGNGVLTDSFDSGDLWKSNFGQYDASVFAGDHGDVASNDSTVGAISVNNARIYGKVHTGLNGTVTVGLYGAVGSHAWQAAGNTGFEDGWVLQDANVIFPDTSLPYNSGLPLGGPQTIVTVTYDYTRTSTHSTVYPNPPPWSGVITNTTLQTNTTLPSPIPAGIITNTIADKSTVAPEDGTYISPYTKLGSWYYYQRITGYSWPVLSYTWTLYATNAVYTTNTYDHVLTSGAYYALDSLHGHTIVLGNARLVLPAGLSMSGMDEIVIGPNGSLELFCGGNWCAVGGNGIINQAGRASNFILTCAATVTNFAFNAYGQFIGVIIAPKADLTMNGAGLSNNDFIGSLAANSVRMNGHFSFHYDEALATMPGPSPWIIVPPHEQIVGRGSSATFAVTAGGFTPLSYQRRLGENSLAGATNSSLTITNAGGEDAGSYSVVVTDSLQRSQTSWYAMLTVIGIEPQPLAALASHEAQFTLTVTPPAPVVRQWQFGGVNIPDETKATLQFLAVTPDQAGEYSVTVTNIYGQVATSTATLVVRDTPAAALEFSPHPGVGPFQFNVTGISGLAYTIEASTNLVDWERLVTNTPPYSFMDPQVTSSAHRFYRAVCKP